MDGRQVGVKTSALEDKCQAFETLLIHASTLNARFGPYVSQVLELALPGLRFYIHDGVQEACAMYVSVSVSSPGARDKLAGLPDLSKTLTHEIASVSGKWTFLVIGVAGSD